MTLDDAAPDRRPTLALAAILAFALFVRIAAAWAAGPGLHVDEASNVWNALCLARAGADEHGVAWPLLYTGAYGDNRSALFLYFVLPVQSLFGPWSMAARVPSVLAGVAAVGLLFVVARRLFDARIALAAAAMLAASPWQITASSWGHESTLCPALVFAGVAALLASGAPLADRAAPPNVRRAIVAGLLFALACYGYPALRLYVPIFLLALAFAALPTAAATLRDPARRQWAIAFVAALIVGVAPLVYAHLTDAKIGLRAQQTWVWEASDSLATRAWSVVSRYPAHFSPRLLAFDTGNDPGQSLPRGFGALAWVAGPLLLVGAWRIVRDARRSTSARVLIAAVVTYPAGDLFAMHEGPNLLRSSPGLAWLELLAGVGLVATIDAVRSARATQAVRLATSAALAIGAVALVVRTRTANTTDLERWRARTNDFREASAWLAPRLKQMDAVFWTQRGVTFVYAPAFAYLGVEPREWFEGPVARSITAGDRFAGADIVFRGGRHHFLYTEDAIAPTLAELRSRGWPARVAVIARPGELSFPTAPDAVVCAPDGRVMLEMREVRP